MKRIVILTALLLLAIIGAKAHNSISNTIKPKTKKGTGIKVAANVQDSLALVALYNSTDGPNWTNNTNWLIGEVEDWWGIILDVGGRCEEVCLPGNNLFGTIPSEIGDLNNLIILNFASNNLSGNIPIEVWNLTNLTKLILRYNSFEGNVPSEIGNLFNLINLELLDNNLTGIIPTETWSLTNLTRLDLGNNNFEGTIPPEIGNLTNLTSLNLSRNNLSGYIPIEIGDLSNLTYLALNINNISGNIPSEIKNLTNLRFLYLGWNNLSGNIPSGIGNLTNLEYLDLSLANLTGTIPDEIGNLTNLFSLSLYQNQLSGSIPIQIGNLTNIVHLRLDGNNLTGSIPTDIGNLIKLSNINLSSNSLSGIIPSEIGNLTQTKSLRLNNNELADLPDLSNLINLESLYIQINKFQFDDLENCGVDFSSLDKVYYSPQDTLILTKIENPDNVIISVNCGGSNNQYQWYKNDELLTGETQSSLTVSKTDEGFYSCIIKDSNYPSLILKTNKEIVGNITCGVFESEYNALATLYNSNGGNDWFNKTNWMSLEPVNDWYGVTVENFHVKNISLSNNNLSGNLPVEISNLTNLDYLSLGNNSITGNLPVGFGNLINITQLYIGNNNFEGSISNEISQLINLKALDISFNNYNILVDISLLINLKFLRVNDNNFEFDDLNTLGIDWSNMNSGSIYSPQDTIQLLKQLSGENVILSVVCGGINNQYKWYKDGLEIVGETQNSLTVDNTKNAYYYCTVQNSNFPNLEIRSESGSTGSIICGIYEIEYNALIEIYNSTNGDNWLNKANWKSNEHVNNWYGITVENFQVAKIELNSNNLSGNIPNQIGNISNLKVLSLGWNKITGSIPNEIGNLNNLNIFNINYNNFTGSIPAEIGNLTNLEYLTIRSTNISGNIPSEIGNLINLKGLCLDRNNLTGNIPLEIFNLINLNYIYISNNNLTGSIPVEISNLKNITNLEFNNNLFNGLPNMSSLTMLDYLTVYDNNFQFEDFDNIGIDLSGISTWQYSPQSNITLSKADNGVSVTLSVNCNSSNNQYQWYKDNIEIIGEINKTIVLSKNTGGVYYCSVSNPDYPNLVLISNNEAVGNLIGGVLEEEYNALVVFYDSTGGDNWNSNTNWKTDEPVNDWYGITVKDFHVSRINLYQNSLTDSIPSEIGILNKLEILDLSRNNLEGALPSEFYNLTELTSLDLANNKFSGNISNEIGNLNQLRYLDMNFNAFSGIIPSGIGNLIELTRLNLSNNELTGNLPAEIYNLTNLYDLDLASNDLTGSVLPEIGNLSGLIYLDINSNNFSGSIPNELVNLTSLNELNLSDNNFNNLPDVSSLNNLNSVFIDINEFHFDDIENLRIDWSGLNDYSYAPQKVLPLSKIENGNNVTLSFICGGAGNINKWYKNDILISGETQNNITISDYDGGSIYFCKVTNSNYPDLELITEADGNLVCGVTESEYNALIALYDSTGGDNWYSNTNWKSTEPVENWYGVYVKNYHVSRISLGYNRLTDSIPPEIGEFKNLENLYLPGNDLSGSIPTEIGNLSNLKYLNFQYNDIEGDMPIEIGNLHNLENLNLYNNDLSGNIPHEIGNLDSLTSLSLSSNELTGNLPNELGNLTKLTFLGLSWNNLTGTIPEEIGNLINLEYLSFEDNELEGGIPTGFSNFNKLEDLYLRGNENIDIKSVCNVFQNYTRKTIMTTEKYPSNYADSILLIKIPIQNTIPIEIGEIINLIEINMCYDTITGNIPAEIGNLTKLETIKLNNNNLTGSIPSEIINLTNLTTLKLNSNNLSGSIPLEVFNIESIDLGDNEFTDLPDLSSSAFTTLNVKNNRLTIEDIEPNISKFSSSDYYSPQKPFLLDTNQTSFCGGSQLGLNIYTFAPYFSPFNDNIYQWYKDGETVGESGAEYVKLDSDNSDEGVYTCQVTNPNVPDLVLTSEDLNVINGSVQLTGTIEGKNLLCQGEQNVVYTITEIENATFYLWDFPAGVTVDDYTAREVTVNYPENTSNFDITVRADNACGFGPLTTYSVNFAATPKILSKWEGGVVFCSNFGDSLETYQWYKDGEIISGATAQFIETNNAAGDYQVETSNVMGCVDKSNVISVAGAKSVKMYPNPVTDKLNVEIEGSIQGEVIISVINNMGIEVKKISTQKYSDNQLYKIPTDRLQNGFYTIKVIVNNKVQRASNIVVNK